jgi:hypothetical protein
MRVLSESEFLVLERIGGRIYKSPEPLHAPLPQDLVTHDRNSHLLFLRDPYWWNPAGPHVGLSYAELVESFAKNTCFPLDTFDFNILFRFWRLQTVQDAEDSGLFTDEAMRSLAGVCHEVRKAGRSLTFTTQGWTETPVHATSVDSCHSSTLSRSPSLAPHPNLTQYAMVFEVNVNGDFFIFPCFKKLYERSLVLMGEHVDTTELQKKTALYLMLTTGKRRKKSEETLRLHRLLLQEGLSHVSGRVFKKTQASLETRVEYVFVCPNQLTHRNSTLFIGYSAFASYFAAGTFLNPCELDMNVIRELWEILHVRDVHASTLLTKDFKKEIDRKLQLGLTDGFPVRCWTQGLTFPLVNYFYTGEVPTTQPSFGHPDLQDHMMCFELWPNNVVKLVLPLVKKYVAMAQSCEHLVRSTTAEADTTMQALFKELDQEDVGKTKTKQSQEKRKKQPQKRKQQKRLPRNLLPLPLPLPLLALAPTPSFPPTQRHRDNKNPFVHHNGHQSAENQTVDVPSRRVQGGIHSVHVPVTDTVIQPLERGVDSVPVDMEMKAEAEETLPTWMVPTGELSARQINTTARHRPEPQTEQKTPTKGGVLYEHNSLPLTLEDSLSMNTCVVCFDQQRSILLLPCRHMVLCSACILQVTACPLCRCAFQSTVTVFM